VTVIQLALVVAVHVQPLVVVTAVAPAPPDAPNGWVIGDTLYAQLVAPLWAI